MTVYGSKVHLRTSDVLAMTLCGEAPNPLGFDPEGKRTTQINSPASWCKHCLRQAVPDEDLDYVLAREELGVSAGQVRRDPGLREVLDRYEAGEASRGRLVEAVLVAVADLRRQDDA